MKIKLPSVAGQFYPGLASSLEKELKGLADVKAKREKVIGAIAPHAGYAYSGKVAASVFSVIEPADTFIILGPNHTGYGKQFSIMSSGIWKTPLGEVKIDHDLGNILLKNSQFLEEDELAHRFEHSIEVQVPFLQYFFSSEKIKIIPIVITTAALADYQALGKELALAVQNSKKVVVVLASSDMTHYEPQEAAEAKDKKAIEKILKLDEESLLEIAKKENITMCGLAPVACLLSYAKEMKATKACLVKYQTSADTSSDFSSVVGYAGVIIL